MIVLTAEQAAEVDRRTIEQVGVPGLVLMETAGRALVRVVEARRGADLWRGAVVVAGPGNNGGDGFVAARVLHARSVPVRVFLFGGAERLKGDAAHNREILRKTAGDAVPVDELHGEPDLQKLRAALSASGVCIDSLFGTGLTRPLEGLAASVVESMNASPRPPVAMDIPSGVNGTTGAINGVAVKAEATVCAGFLKRGLVLYPGAACCGELYVAEIGFPPALGVEVADGVELVEPAQVQAWLPAREPTAHKGSAGRLTIVAGSDGMTGAAMLTARGALRTGAGLVTLCLPATLHGHLHEAPLEALTRAIPDGGQGAFVEASLAALMSAVGSADAVAVGPGAGRGDSTRAVLARLLDGVQVAAVVDADALRALPLLTTKRPDRVLTPHPGEMSSLIDRDVREILADPIGAARACASRWQAVALLKGAHTVVAAPDGRVRINFTGNPGMASGGMGDTLTGIIASLLAQGVSAFDAASAGAFIHGRSADLWAGARGQRGLLAHDVADSVPAAVAELLAASGTIPFPRTL